MKKIGTLTLIIILCLGSACRVMGKTNTSWQPIESLTQQENIEIEYRYRYYQLQKEGEHLSFDKNNDYQYVDETDLSYGEYSNWQEICDNSSNFDILIQDVYPYQKIEQVKYVFFSHHIIIDDILELQFLNNANKVNYSIIDCPSCIRGKEMLVELDGYYDLNKLSFWIHTQSIGPLQYTVSWATLADKNTILATKKVYDEIWYQIDSTWLTNKVYSPRIYYNESSLLNDDFTINYPSITMCKQREKLYYHYNLVSHYLDDNYYNTMEGYIKDEQDYKIYYRIVNNEDTAAVSNDLDQIIEKTNIEAKDHQTYNTINTILPIDPIGGENNSYESDNDSLSDKVELLKSPEEVLKLNIKEEIKQPVVKTDDKVTITMFFVVATILIVGIGIMICRKISHKNNS